MIHNCISLRHNYNMHEVCQEDLRVETLISDNSRYMY